MKLLLLVFGSYLSISDDRQGTFYRFVTSDFFLLPFGKILIALTQFFLNQFLTLAVGLALNNLCVSIQIREKLAAESFILLMPFLAFPNLGEGSVNQGIMGKIFNF